MREEVFVGSPFHRFVLLYISPVDDYRLDGKIQRDSLDQVNNSNNVHNDIDTHPSKVSFSPKAQLASNQARGENSL